MDKIIILDTNAGEVYILKIDSKEEETQVEEFCENNDIQYSAVQWMTGNGVVHVI